MVALNFLGYHTEEMFFKKNDAYKQKGKIALNPELGVEISRYDNNIADISLSVKIDKEDAPFEVFVKIKGNFSFDQEEGEKQELDFNNMLNINGVAIIYPYIRALVTNLTSMANEYKPYILPTINIAQAFMNSKESSE